MSQTTDTTFSIIILWFNTYGIIPTIVALVTIIGFYLKLRNDLDNLKGDLKRLKDHFDEHPIIVLFKQWERTEGVYTFFNSVLKNSSVEKN
jgi:hypothetical protein